MDLFSSCFLSNFNRFVSAMKVGLAFSLSQPDIGESPIIIVYTVLSVSEKDIPVS